MRIILSVVGCLLMVKATAQDISKQQYIQLTYTPNRAYVEQATEKIAAINTVLARTTVEYRAGHTVELLPGFEAKQGSIFTARVQDVRAAGLRLVAFPNPFEKSTTISFDLPETGVINLFVVNEKGQIVEHLLENSKLPAGKHQVEWKADAHTSGIYIPVLKTPWQQASSRVIKK